MTHKIIGRLRTTTPDTIPSVKRLLDSISPVQYGYYYYYTTHSLKTTK